MRKSHPGLLEIKIHFPQRKNSVNGESMQVVRDVIRAAQSDKNVKVIMIHGGRYFSSGLDLMSFKDFGSMTPDQRVEAGSVALKTQMTGMLMEMSSSKKPIVTVVRGGAMGIGFTMLPHSTFIYASPESTWQTPFMRSGQSPEGAYTLLFPEVFGTRFANQLLLNDYKMNV